MKELAIPHPEPTSSFKFITITKPEDAKDKDRRRIVRKYVMKNIGRARRKPPSNPTIELFIDSECQLASGEIDPFVNFPFELTASDRELVANIFRDVDGTQRAMRPFWYPLGLEDPAAMHMILSNSAAHLDCLQGRNGFEESEPATRHMLLALEDIRQRMDNPQLPVTDGLMAAVCGMSFHNTIIGNYDAWKLHNHGLWMLVMRRGGIGAIQNTNLRVSISWEEISGSYPQDRAPVYPLPNEWVETYSTSRALTCLSHALAKECRKTLPARSKWVEIYERLVDCSAQTESDAVQSKGACWMQSSNCGGWPNVLIYHLLEWRPLESRTGSVAIREEIVRLAALLYMAPIWRKFGQFPVRTRYLVDKLLPLLKKDKDDWGPLWPLKMWALYMGVLESEQPEAAAYFPRALAAYIHERQLRSWREVIRTVKSVLWLDSIFNESCDLVKDDMEDAVDADRLAELNND